MKLVDANVLLYAVNDSVPHHRASRAWIEQALSGNETVGFAWLVLLAFVRLSTRSGIFPQPLTTEQAFDRVDAWLDAPAGVVVEPTAQHALLVRDLMRRAGHGGNLTNDAHLAALAIEHRAEVVTFDRDFERFDGVTTETPSTP